MFWQTSQYFITNYSFIYLKHVCFNIDCEVEIWSSVIGYSKLSTRYVCHVSEEWLIVMHGNNNSSHFLLVSCHLQGVQWKGWRWSQYLYYFYLWNIISKIYDQSIHIFYENNMYIFLTFLVRPRLSGMVTSVARNNEQFRNIHRDTYYGVHFRQVWSAFRFNLYCNQLGPLWIT